MWQVWWMVYRMNQNGSIGTRLTDWTNWEHADEIKRYENKAKRGVWMHRTRLPRDAGWG